MFTCTGAEDGAGASESVGGIQEHPLSASGSETTPTDWGGVHGHYDNKSPWITCFLHWQLKIHFQKSNSYS